MTFRQCVICLLEEPEDDAAWLIVCPCSLRVHQDCLLLWVQVYEEIHLMPAKCPVCSFPYRILPQRDSIVVFMEFTDRRLYENICELLYYLWQLLFVEISFAVSGLLSLWLVYGSVEANLMVFSMKPWWAWGLCRYTIPLTLLFIASTPWDEIVLVFLRRASRFPVLNMILPKEEENVSVERGDISHYHVLGDATLLLACTKAVATILFAHESSKLRAFLLGGAVFIAVKGVFNMYYKQFLHRRRYTLTVDDYNST